MMVCGLEDPEDDWPSGMNSSQPVLQALHWMATQSEVTTPPNHSHPVSTQPYPAETVYELVSQDGLENVTVVFVLVLIPLLAVFGVVGNILSLVVLVNARMRSTTNLCLAGLAISDLLLLCHSLAFSAFQIHARRDPVGAKYASVVTYPVLAAYGSIVCARITTWLTTMLGVERCIAVYFPMRARAINSRRGTLLAIGAIYIVTALAFLPTALQYHVTYVGGGGPNNSSSSMPVLVHSALGRNKEFMVPYGNALNVVFRFVPLAVLVVVNALIIAAIRRTGVLRRTISWNRSHTAGQEQARITLMLLTVSGVFLLCTLPGAINTIVSRSVHSYSKLGQQKNLYQAVSTVTYFLETLNSSVNFIIYMAFSTKFCRTYQEIFCCRPSPWHLLPASLRTVRFVPRGGSKTSITATHELHFLKHRPPHTLAYPHPQSSGAQRLRFLGNGYLRSSFDMEEEPLQGRHAAARVPNGAGMPCGSCCSCHRSRRSRSQSQSHSSDSAANQYS